jgi:hypothetical protein
MVLDFLYEIREWAIDDGYVPEELAISLENFECVGLSPQLALNLEQAGLVKRKVRRRPDEHGGSQPVSSKQAASTTQKVDGIWLTELGGTTWKAEIEKKHYNTGRHRKARNVLVPVWWPKTRQLCLWDREVRHFKQLSPNVEEVLEEYRESGCAPVVKTPFWIRGAKRGRCLRGALFSINADQENPKVVFTADKGALTFKREVI